ncbi:MAG: transporter [Actinobacteria bacterium]|nr:MAG: transporter [Actinomycetota bacterium]
MVEFLVENEFITLFLVLTVGSLIGRITIRGFSLGVSAVLFVGLAVGALDPALAVPEWAYLFGLILFVYTVGVSAGPGFVSALRHGGLAANLLVAVVLCLTSVLAWGLARLAGLTGAVASGVFAGALTNTPALAAVLQYQTENAPQGGLVTALAEPVVGYSVTYPFGVLGVIVAVYLLHRFARRPPPRGEAPVPEGVLAEDLIHATVTVSDPAVIGRTIGQLLSQEGWHVVFSRHRREGDLTVGHRDVALMEGDVVTIVGPPEEVERVVAAIGERTAEALPYDRSDLDYRRIFVSASEPVGRTIGDLRLPDRFDAVATRVKRGDADRLATQDTVLEPGDRIRVVAPRARMDEVTAFFGDSYRSLSEIDIAVVGLGILIGLLLGLVPIPLPGGTTFQLGLAGGPLVAGLVLGALERTGPITWQLPYNANLTLRQLGVALFLAGVGTRSGYVFVETLRAGGAGRLLLVGAAVTVVSAVSVLVVARYLLRMPVDVATGVEAGVQTQPAVLAFAVGQAKNDLPNVGYATVYPVATIAKIVLAQALLVIVG